MAMLRSVAVCYALNVYVVANALKPLYTGSLYVPTLGEVWPRPLQQIRYNNTYSFDPQIFKVTIMKETCAMLLGAINRCIFNLKSLQTIVIKHGKKSENNDDKNKKEPMQKLHVTLTSECEEYPHLGMEEAYYLEVGIVSSLSSTSIWGIIRGLETFSQLFFVTPDDSEVCIRKTQINDSPRYSHRGLLIDTSRHFLSLTSILVTIKALAINKMNVLHWHMTDDQSFPYQSEILPALSRRGAFHSSMVYTKSDIQKVIDYARDRGIRVIPEFNVPSHTLSWGVAFPHILAECYNENNEKLGSGVMNPIIEITYRLIRYLFAEVVEVFKDKYFHLGGDEVNFPCWESNPSINKYMKDNDMKSSDLLALFFKNTFPLVKNSTPIVWQEVFDEHVPLNFDALVQIWKGDGEAMLKPIQEGYYVLYSTKWYLDRIDTFDDFYNQDPRQMVVDITNKPWDAKRVLGGEACMWGENVDDQNLISRVWPRTCAVAERLWSAAEKTYQEKVEVKYRLEEHVCRMNRRGISLPPLGPGFCVV